MSRQHQKGPDYPEFLKAAGVSPWELVAPSRSVREAQWLPINIKLAPPIVPRIIRTKSTNVEAYKESETEIELVGSNGAKILVTGYTKKIETNGTYYFFTSLKTNAFAKASDGAPTESSTSVISTYGKIGKVEAGFRTDEVTTTIIGMDGLWTVGPRLVRRPIAGSFEDTSADELLDVILKPILNN